MKDIVEERGSKIDIFFFLEDLELIFWLFLFLSFYKRFPNKKKHLLPSSESQKLKKNPVGGFPNKKVKFCK